MTTVIVTNVSPNATERNLTDFFSFSGEIESIELKTEADGTQTARVTFKNSKSLDTALLLTGAVIVDRAVSITAEAPASAAGEGVAAEGEAAEGGSGTASAERSADAPAQAASSGAASSLKRAEDVVQAMLAKGYNLAAGSLSKARELDQKHQLTARAYAKVKGVDDSLHISDTAKKVVDNVGSVVNVFDQKYHISETASSTINSAQQSAKAVANRAMQNPTVAAGVGSVYGSLTKLASNVGQATSNFWAAAAPPPAAPAEAPPAAVPEAAPVPEPKAE
eukprot:jgi/Mesvir1/16933/Mv15792-RA.1